MPRRARTAPGEIIYHALDRANGRAPNWVNRAQTEAENRKETAVSAPTPKKEEKPVKPESKAREEVLGKGTNESAIKREEKSVTPETKVREEAIQKESSPSSEKEKDQN